MNVKGAEDLQNSKKHYQTTPIMAAFLLSGFVGLFSETALNVALSSLMDLFQISASMAQWLTTGYLLTLGILVPLSGLLLQWFSTRQLFVFSLSLSIAGTLIAALATGFEVLLIGRIIQAASMAVLVPLMFNTILIIFPPEKRGGVIGILGLVLVVAPATGPTLSGIIIGSLGWQWIFWLSLPVIGFCLLLGLRFIQNVSTISKPKIDLFSLIVSTVGFGGIVFAFSGVGEGEGGWGSAEVIYPMIAGVLALLVFVWRQNRIKQPMLNLRALKYPMFSIGTLMLFVCMLLILTAMVVLPMYLIKGLGLDALTAGLILLPGGILQAIMSPVMGKMFDKFGPRWIVPLGLIVISAALFFLKGISESTPLILIMIMHTGLMVGICAVWMPSQTNGLNQLPLELYPHGSAIMNTIQQIAGAIGTAIAISLITVGSHAFIEKASDPTDPVNDSLALIAGVQTSFVFALAVALVGLPLAFFIKRVQVDNPSA
ncbi:DHA2 family efflux MFS transporter permease subunit [Paenibacillus prosopidis]|uniref:DHA2 family lincomycin resistance protein-like MFS transporter n=1 Tax=Paenibacillus prosopidis TaxID=630520 RepID=A0A368WAE6_9BACL|nr:DHA2 family efflux MFS transporter permease subunit [Paenibacillus prosopidis]RCW51668.1 DHA2 family lincomycin resistance protein-like MFS transporter [Paenibacillus prosopidis]